jgi:uncharacterized membrane protein
MGAADVVIGVTIALLIGIYERLFTAIRRVNFSALKYLKNDGIKACWQYRVGSI